MTHDWKHYKELGITVCRVCGRKKCKERLKEECLGAPALELIQPVKVDEKPL